MRFSPDNSNSNLPWQTVTNR